MTDKKRGETVKYKAIILKSYSNEDMCTGNLTSQMVCYTKPSGKLEKVWKRVDNFKNT